MEACLFPAPTEALLVALSLARPRRSWRLAALAVLASLAGALAAYAAGVYLVGEAGFPFASSSVARARIAALGDAYRGGAFWVLATSGYTPVPYLVYTTAAGVYGVPLLPFVAGALVGRALKYFFLGTLTFYLGPTVRLLLTRHRTLTAWLLVVFLLVLMMLAMLRWTSLR